LLKFRNLDFKTNKNSLKKNGSSGLVKTVACVVLRVGKPGCAETASELQRFVLERLPVFKRPHAIEFFSELPKTATGKLQRYRLR